MGQTPATLEPVSVRTDRAHSGKYALASRLLTNESFYFIDVLAPVCGANGADVSGKKIRAWVLSDAETAYACLVDSCVLTQKSQWTFLETTMQGSLSYVKVEIMGSGVWNGRVYVDDVSIEP
jgi:hypothetical protein